MNRVFIFVVLDFGLVEGGFVLDLHRRVVETELERLVLLDIGRDNGNVPSILFARLATSHAQDDLSLTDVVLLPKLPGDQLHHIGLVAEEDRVESTSHLYGAVAQNRIAMANRPLGLGIDLRTVVLEPSSEQLGELALALAITETSTAPARSTATLLRVQLPGATLAVFPTGIGERAAASGDDSLDLPSVEGGLATRAIANLRVIPCGGFPSLLANLQRFRELTALVLPVTRHGITALMAAARGSKMVLLGFLALVENRTGSPRPVMTRFGLHSPKIRVERRTPVRLVCLSERSRIPGPAPTNDPIGVDVGKLIGNQVQLSLLALADVEEVVVVSQLGRNDLPLVIGTRLHEPHVPRPEDGRSLDPNRVKERAPLLIDRNATPATVRLDLNFSFGGR
jgi:hypothetical protein